MTLDEYTDWYNSLPWYTRLYNRLWWKADSIWSAIVGKSGPGERMVLKTLGRVLDERR